MQKKITNVFTVLTVALMGFWLKYPDSVQWEAIIGILLIIKEVTIRWQMRKIESMEFSPAISLAQGYVKNFLEPAIIELTSKNGADLHFMIYMPEDLEELSEHQIDNMKNQIEMKGFRLKEIKLKRKFGRPHDILTVEKQEGSVSYFDFPRTLLSLHSYIDYKVESAKNEVSDEKRLALGKKLIIAFHNEIQRLAKKKNIENFITYVDKSVKL